MAEHDLAFPVPKFHFKVTIDDNEIAFQEVSGLDQEAEFLEYRSGKDKELVTQKRLGLIKTSTIVMKKGIFKNDLKLYNIFKKIYTKGSYYSTSSEGHLPLQIQLLDENSKPVMTWKVKEAVPIKLVGTDLKSDASEIAIESIEFVHTGIEIE